MYLITGATGFLGREVLRRLLVTRPDVRVALLVRPKMGRTAEERIHKLLVELFGTHEWQRHLSRIELVEGDVALEHFGIGAGAFLKLSQKLSAVFHIAATTDLNQDLQNARAVNVGGVESVLALCRLAAVHCPNFRLHYISTAFVAGDTEEVVGPDRLLLDAPFKNAYEQSKAEAEAAVRGASAEFSTTIYRPSVIVGDSITGETSAFNVLYIPARMLVTGVFKALPCRPNIPFDVVPVDYVANALLALSQRAHGSGQGFHLCAGVGRETSPIEILHAIVAAVNRYGRVGLAALSLPPLIYLERKAIAQFSLSALSVAKEGVRTLERIFHGRTSLFAQILPFFAYMNRNPRFDSIRTDEALREVLAPAPLFTNYADRLFNFCIETNWGRRPIQAPSYSTTSLS